MCDMYSVDMNRSWLVGLAAVSALIAPIAAHASGIAVFPLARTCGVDCGRVSLDSASTRVVETASMTINIDSVKGVATIDYGNSNVVTNVYDSTGAQVSSTVSSIKKSEFDFSGPNNPVKTLGSAGCSTPLSWGNLKVSTPFTLKAAVSNLQGRTSCKS